MENFSDRQKATQHVDAFFGVCPVVNDGYPLRILGSHGSTGVQAAAAKALREHLASASNPNDLHAFESLWNLEFKQRPPSEHAELRKTITADVQRIRALAPEPSLPLLRLIRDGYKQGSNNEAATKVDDEILERFPASKEAAEITRERWHKEHPYPKPSESEDKKREYSALQYELSARWMERWPYEALPRAERFYSARGLKDLPPAELKAAADQLLNFLRENPVLWSFPPHPNQAAEEYLKRGIFLEEVPLLAEAGLKVTSDREGKRKPSDMDPPEMAKRTNSSLRNAELLAIEQIAQAYTRLKQPAKASELQARLDKIDAPEDTDKAAKLKVASRVAELAGRKADALAYLEKNIRMQPKPTNDWMVKQQEELRADALRIWKDLGGSEKTWKLRSEPAAEIKEAKAEAGWKAPEKILPAFELADLQGKRWKLDSFAGKTVLINLWATWCGPCRGELPHFQKLYEKLKDRKDVAIISFNVDDQVGIVQPYLDQNKYTFPVLFAGPFIQSMFTGGFSIPRNWLLDSKGTHRYERLGFGESSAWEQRMIEMLDKVSGGKQ